MLHISLNMNIYLYIWYWPFSSSGRRADSHLLLAAGCCVGWGSSPFFVLACWRLFLSDGVRSPKFRCHNISVATPYWLLLLLFIPRSSTQRSTHVLHALNIPSITIWLLRVKYIIRRVCTARCNVRVCLTVSRCTTTTARSMYMWAVGCGDYPCIRAIVILFKDFLHSK